MEAGAKAFAALMRHLKVFGQDYHTVIMMQVKTKLGSWAIQGIALSRPMSCFDQPVDGGL